MGWLTLVGDWLVMNNRVVLSVSDSTLNTENLARPHRTRQGQGKVRQASLAIPGVFHHGLGKRILAGKKLAKNYFQCLLRVGFFVPKLALFPSPPKVQM